MQRRLLTLTALGTVCALVGCTSGQSAVVPPSTAVNLQATSKLQFAVGTANINGTLGLNTVETFRSTNGLSATLVNSPSITGPAGFVVPAAPDAGTDAGTNSITSAPQVAAGTSTVSDTFGLSGGAFAYGFAPLNSDTTGAANFGSYNLPFYVPNAAKINYLIGPGNTFVTNFRDGTQPPGFNGFSTGFTDFAATPVAGTYNLTVHIPAVGNSVPDFKAAATLTSVAPLPLLPVPVYTSTLAADGAGGGGTVAITVPPGVTETMVFVQDLDNGLMYTLFTRATGAQVLTLPNNIGPKGADTIPLGANIAIYAAGFDYPAMEASPIGANPPQAPAITGANGQADITLSDIAVQAE